MLLRMTSSGMVTVPSCELAHMEDGLNRDSPSSSSRPASAGPDCSRDCLLRPLVFCRESVWNGCILFFLRQKTIFLDHVLFQNERAPVFEIARSKHQRNTLPSKA